MYARAAPALTLFTREPAPGVVKTRLVPALGSAGAASLARRLLEWTAENARRHWCGPVRIAVWPPVAVGRLAPVAGLAVAAQRGGDLGERMMASIADAGGAPAAVLGCDVPQLDGAVLRRAARCLADGKAVVGPATDGGFYLIGLQHPEPALFEGIPWGGAGVLERVRLNAARLGIAFETLAKARDIDTPADLEAVAHTYPPLAEWVASHSAAVDA